MIRFVRFHVQGMNIAIRPEHVTSITCDEGTPDVCYVFTTESDQPVTVHSLFDDVVAALEAAGAPAVAPVVEVAPTDLEMAALLLQVVASEIDDQELDHLAEHVNSEIGTRYDTDRHDGAISRLHNLAARLRGAR